MTTASSQSWADYRLALIALSSAAALGAGTMLLFKRQLGRGNREWDEDTVELDMSRLPSQNIKPTQTYPDAELCSTPADYINQAFMNAPYEKPGAAQSPNQSQLQGRSPTTSLASTSSQQEVTGPEDVPYTWTQNEEEVVIVLTGLGGVKPQDVCCKITPTRLLLAVQDETVIDGLLSHPVHPTDSSWQFEGCGANRRLTIFLAKTGTRGPAVNKLWHNVIRGHPEIDPSLTYNGY